jgi:hypothetical protein
MQKTIVRFSFYTIFCVIGIFVAFYPALLGGSAKIPFELGDFRLNHYFLEHSWQWIHNPQYTGKLYSPSFFFPFKNVLTFSDNLFGSAPIYWLLRLFTVPDIAFIGWIVLISCLNFASMTFVLRQEKIHPLLAALGGFIFAFPMMRVMQTAHTQLLPQFCTPLALWLTWRFFKAADIRKFCGILLLVYWQILCGIYLGWFLMLALLVLGLVAIATHKKGRSNLWHFLRNSWGSALAAVLLWGGALYGLLSPYIKTKALMGGHTYDSIIAFLPKLNSWILVPPSNTFWSNLLGKLSGNLAAPHEHYIFFGLVGSLAVVVAIASLRIEPSGIKGLDNDHQQMVKTFLLTGLIIVLLSLNFSDGLSLWKVIYKVVPGASAIRAVSRIALVTLPFFIIAGFIGLNGWIRRFDQQKVLQIALLISITTFGILEQRVDSPPSPEYDLVRAQVRATHVELSQLVKQYCQVAYLSPLNPDTPSATQAGELIYNHIDAMWAGITANRPVINGYSGFPAPGFSLMWGEKAQIVGWLQAQKSPPIDRLCFIQRQGVRPEALASGTERLERHQSERYSLEVRRYP